MKPQMAFKVICRSALILLISGIIVEVQVTSTTTTSTSTSSPTTPSSSTNSSSASNITGSSAAATTTKLTTKVNHGTMATADLFKTAVLATASLLLVKANNY